jgi:hypothetical protein
MSLFSLIALFFIGIQQTQAQELQRKSLDESKGKDKQVQMNELANKEREQSPEVKAKKELLQMTEVENLMTEINEYIPTLSDDQQSEMHAVFKGLNNNLEAIGKDEKSQKGIDARASLNEEADLKIRKALDEEQYILYKEFIDKYRQRAE